MKYYMIILIGIAIGLVIVALVGYTIQVIRAIRVMIERGKEHD